jgi:hypothetical protein
MSLNLMVKNKLNSSQDTVYLRMATLNSLIKECIKMQVNDTKEDNQMLKVEKMRSI